MLNVNYNPDVLTCLANLSSDEVFTPPRLANQILDLLPKEIWGDPDTRFLDPVSKSGVFLREITRRLDVGLADKIPNKQARINHIFRNQVFGLAITELTALLSRRSVYCSKTANGKYSVCEAFSDPQGNIRFTSADHTWKNGHCVFCGASQQEYDRSRELETHAYQFIHTMKPEEIFKMKFDVIVGNPPYQLSDAGFGRSASPIYQHFVRQAKKLKPTYLTMIIPSRWFAGGKGLGAFREEMLNDDQTRKLVDYEDASEVFPGVDIAGGICYFLWERNTHGPCEIVNMYKGVEVSKSIRRLNEFDTLIRHGSAVSIIRKVQRKNEKSMSLQVSSRKPFGLSTNARPLKYGDIKLRWNNGEGPFSRKQVAVGTDLIDTWKVITSKVSYDHAGQPDNNGMRRVLSIVDILPPGIICTETYIVAGSFKDKSGANNLAAYLRTKLVRFLISQLSFSQDITKERFYFVPVLDMKTRWTDTVLYKRYGLAKDEVGFIEAKIKPMD
jgi:site-specific DNA-methyltransferase (adenine-specific)